MYCNVSTESLFHEMGKISDKFWTLHSLWTSELLKNKIICSFSLNLFKTFNTISFKSSVMTLECFVRLVVWTFFQFILVSWSTEARISLLGAFQYSHLWWHLVDKHMKDSLKLQLLHYDHSFNRAELTASVCICLTSGWSGALSIYFFGGVKKLRYVYFIDKSFLVYRWAMVCSPFACDILMGFHYL